MPQKDVYICHSKEDSLLVKGLCKVLDEQNISYITSQNGEEESRPSQNVTTSTIVILLSLLPHTTATVRLLL